MLEFINFSPLKSMRQSVTKFSFIYERLNKSIFIKISNFTVFKSDNVGSLHILWSSNTFLCSCRFFSLYDISWLRILCDGNSRLEGEKRKGWERRSLQNSLRAPLLPASPFLFLFCLCALCLHLCFFVLTVSECMLPSTCSGSSLLAAVSVNQGRFSSQLLYPIHAAVHYMFTATARELFS